MDLLVLTFGFLGLLAVQTAGQGKTGLPISPLESRSRESSDGIIDIDDLSEGSASGSEFDEEDSSGKGDTEDGKDTEEGSAYDPGLTPCQTQRQDSLRRNDEDFYIPQCQSDGTFARKQCHSRFQICWCVDIKGLEITGTKMDESEFNQNCDSPVIRLPTQPPGTPPASSVEPNKQRTPEPIEPRGIDGDHETPTDTYIKTGKQEPSPSNAPMNPGTPSGSPVSKNQYKYNGLYFLTQPGILIGVISGAVLGLLCTVLGAVLIVCRKRKQGKGRHLLQKQKNPPIYRGIRQGNTLKIAVNCPQDSSKLLADCV